MDNPENGCRESVIDAKGWKRGMKQWVVCPMCSIGRWVREDAVKLKSFSAMCNICHNKFTSPVRESHGRWKGGRVQHERYILVKLLPENQYHEMTTKNGYVREHRLVMAEHLGRCLSTQEIVHHKNGDKKDNRIENLELFGSIGAHLPSINIENMGKIHKKCEALSVRVRYLELLLSDNGISFQQTRQDG